MLQSRLFAFTKKEVPKEAKVTSHQLLLKGDFIDQLAAGIYSFLPLGWLVHRKIEKIIREEMLKLNAQEVFLPALQPKSLWEETKRWDEIDPPLFKLKDRHQKEWALAPTHEEVITDLVRKRIKSYKDLPLFLFQIQDKFRNEMRPTGGLLRTREFLMKDLYSFHSKEKDLLAFYQKVKKSYFRIFRRCGLKDVLSVEADPGTIGGKLSEEFMVLAEKGEDKILFCQKCNFGVNLEKAKNLKICQKCGKKLEKKNAIEVGHIFYLGEKYSLAMANFFVDEKGKKKPILMGCYGIGLGRLMAAILEKNHDEKGIIWPKEVSPFQVHLIEIGNSKAVKKLAKKFYHDLQKEGIEVLYDERRDVSAGEKFADCDLIGIPIRIVLSERTLREKSFEIKGRKEKKAKFIKISNFKSILEKLKGKNV